jgi:hypothetical protein
LTRYSVGKRGKRNTAVRLASSDNSLRCQRCQCLHACSYSCPAGEIKSPSVRLLRPNDTGYPLGCQPMQHPLNITKAGLIVNSCDTPGRYEVLVCTSSIPRCPPPRRVYKGHLFPQSEPFNPASSTQIHCENPHRNIYQPSLSNPNPLRESTQKHLATMKSTLSIVSALAIFSAFTMAAPAAEADGLRLTRDVTSDAVTVGGLFARGNGCPSPC